MCGRALPGAVGEKTLLIYNATLSAQTIDLNINIDNVGQLSLPYLEFTSHNGNAIYRSDLLSATVLYESLFRSNVGDKYKGSIVTLLCYRKGTS
jgi:hypothetical protein